MPEVIFFDLDDTIISNDGAGRKAWIEASRLFAGRSGLPEAEELHEAIREEGARYWSDPERHRIGRLSLDATRRAIVASAMEKLGIPDEQLAGELADSFIRLQEASMHLFPGAEEALRALKKRGIRLALLTNGSIVKQRAKIERFALAQHFEAIFIEEEVGFGKPELRAYENALQTMAVVPENAWMVGDNLEWDVAAPQKLGIYAIWNDYRGRGLPEGAIVRPDRIVQRIAELME